MNETMVHVLKGMLDVYEGKATLLLLQSQIRILNRPNTNLLSP